MFVRDNKNKFIVKAAVVTQQIHFSHEYLHWSWNITSFYLHWCWAWAVQKNLEDTEEVFLVSLAAKDASGHVGYEDTSTETVIKMINVTANK